MRLACGCWHVGADTLLRLWVLLCVSVPQDATEPRVRWLEEQLGALGLADAPAATGLVTGALCCGRFSLDNNW